MKLRPTPVPGPLFRSFRFAGTLLGPRIVIARTGDVIALEPSFLWNVARVATYVGEVSAVIMGRAATAAMRGRWRRAPHPRIAFLPQRPAPWYAIWSVCRLAGVDIVDDPASADLLFHFEDADLVAPAAPDTAQIVLNGACTDIRKSTVAERFATIFGYSLAVDPTSHTGPMVEKSEANGVHDGRIIDGPIAAPAPGKVYQRLIESTRDGRLCRDLRTYVVGGRLSVVFIKERRRDIRFSNDNDRVSVTLPGRCFSAMEQAQIRAFAAAMHLDFGGLDILRDRVDGRIYIVDVNKTDLGPPIALRQGSKRPSMQRLAEDFRAFVDAAIRGGDPAA